MGMFSEIAADIESRKLEAVLLKAAQTCNQDIIIFAKQHIYPLYLEACSEAWSSPSEHMVSIYGEQNG